MNSKLLLAAATDPFSGTVGGVGTWPVIGWIAILFGYLMRGIFLGFGAIGVYDVTLCILVFTIVTKMLVLPLTIKQQKFSKVQALMNPEIQALQKKYKDKKDQASMAKMQAEQQAIYEKYGASMTAGCLPSLIQLPILFAFYPVILYFSYYVPELLQLNEDVQHSFFMLGNIDLVATPLELFQNGMSEGGLLGGITTWAWIIPILAGGFQFLSVKLTSALSQSPSGEENPAMGSMKTMTYIMPIISVVFCFTFNGFIGVYWVIQSVIMVIQQFFINRYFDKIDVQDLIKANIEKLNKKRAKKGLPPVSDKPVVDIKKEEVKKEKTEEELRIRDEKVKESTEYYNKRAENPNSLAAKANMVRDYNERHKK